MQLLIEKGAAIDATDKDGWTPLHAACRQGNTNVVLLLVNAKASIVCRSRVRPATHNFTQSDGARSDNLFGQAGKLPREYAVAQGCDKIVELLDAASEGGDLSQFRRDDGAGPNGGQPGSSPQASANAGVTSGPNPKLSAEVKRVEGNDESLEEINWTGQPGVDMSALCALADALPANMHVRRIILKDVKALTDPIGTRIGASLPYCAVQVIHVDGSNLSPGKIEELNSLCLMNDVRQVAANLPRLSGVLWKGRHATDKTVAALAENLRGNTQVLIIDLSYVSSLQSLSHSSQVLSVTHARLAFTEPAGPRRVRAAPCGCASAVRRPRAPSHRHSRLAAGNRRAPEGLRRQQHPAGRQNVQARAVRVRLGHAASVAAVAGRADAAGAAAAAAAAAGRTAAGLQPAVLVAEQLGESLPADEQPAGAGAGTGTQPDRQAPQEQAGRQPTLWLGRRRHRRQGGARRGGHGDAAVRILAQRRR